MLLLVVVMMIVSSDAFTIISPACHRATTMREHSLSMAGGGGGMFDGISNFFSQFENNDENNEQDTDDDDEDVPAGTFRVVTIPVSSIKPGGLRLFLMFYLMGMQNTPDTGTWKPDKPTSDEYIVDFYYHDRSAMLSVMLQDNQITVDRVGSTPSTAYLMQESVIVDGILDELAECAFDETIQLEHRLLVLPKEDAIDKARQELAFG